MAQVTKFTYHPEGLDAILAGKRGELARALGRRAQRVETAAKLNATGRAVKGARNPEGRGPRVRTGRLRSSITWGIHRDDRGHLFASVGTNVFYGKILELEGTKLGRTYPFLFPALAAARE